MEIKLTSIFVDDQDKALKFYTEVLGFVKKMEFPVGKFKWLTVVSPKDPDGTQLLLEPNDNASAKVFQQALFDEGITATSFVVGNIEAEYERLRNLGVVFTLEPTKVPGSTCAVLNDTCGNLIEITQVDLRNLRAKEKENDQKKNNLLYTEFAEWWPLFSPPVEYAEEAETYKNEILGNSKHIPETLLELGSGGGNNASHMKKYFKKMTLVDLSEQMLNLSRALNPECTHVQGDMRDVRLGQEYDAVFIHDAIEYMTTREELKQAITTAFVHCRPGGVALFVPDWTSEHFKPSASNGGEDQEKKVSDI